MASGGSKALSGAAAGAAAGSAAGPWGALAGGVIGGVSGLLQGDDPSAPPPQTILPPVTPGGISSQYGGMMIDPVTHRIVYTDNASNAGMTAGQYQNLSLRDLLMGGGNAAQLSLADQIATQRALIQRLQGTGQAPQGGASIPAEYQELVSNYTDPKTGKLLDISNADEIAKNPNKYPEYQGMLKEFWSKNRHGTTFKDWISDHYDKVVKPLFQNYQQTQQVQTGNQQTNAEAIQAAQQRLDTLQHIQEQGGAPQGNNPLMNYLNQRNMSPTAPNYQARFGDPNTAATQGLFEDFMHRAGQNQDSSALHIAGGADPGMPDVAGENAKLGALEGRFHGAMGGRYIDQLGDYNPGKLNDFLRNLNRVSERDFESRDALQREQAARRGVMGGSDIARLSSQQALEDTLSANAAQGYQLDEQGRNNWLNRKFAIDQHNSDVARQGASAETNFLLNLSGQRFGNELAAKNLYDQLQNQVFGNNLAAQRQNFEMGNTMLGQHTALDQRTIDNIRAEQGLDRANFADRMGLLSYLSGEDQRGFGQGITQSQMTMGQAGLGSQVGTHITDAANSANAANTASRNAYDLARWQQDINDSAQRTNAMGQLGGALGMAAGSYFNRPPATTETGYNPATSPTGIAAIPSASREAPAISSSLWTPQTAQPSYGVYNPAQPARAANPSNPWINPRVS